jgi:DNA-binding transcriptional MocR family regulator
MTAVTEFSTQDTLSDIFRDSKSNRTLPSRIASWIETDVKSGRLKPGERLLSIRAFAKSHRVSKQSVVAAYDLLTADGLISAVPGSGYYVARIEPSNTREAKCADENYGHSMPASQELLANSPHERCPGSATLSPFLVCTAEMRQSISRITKSNMQWLGTVQPPRGYLPLRTFIARALEERMISVAPENILLTMGASRTLEFVCMALFSPGDAILVDSPCWSGHFAILKSFHLRVVGVPRGPEGPNLLELERLIVENRPKAYISTASLQNPTGSSLPTNKIRAILELTRKNAITVIEDDVFGDLGTSCGFASIAGIENVIYVSSFSKVLSVNTKVGYVVANDDILGRLLSLQTMHGGACSGLDARVVNELIMSGFYRKYMLRLRRSIAIASAEALGHLYQLGLEPFVNPLGSLFMWVDVGRCTDALSQTAFKEGFLLAPGRAFDPEQQHSNWMRFNVTNVSDPRFLIWLKKALEK